MLDVQNYLPIYERDKICIIFMQSKIIQYRVFFLLTISIIRNYKEEHYGEKFNFQ